MAGFPSAAVDLHISGVKVHPQRKQNPGRECKDGPRYLRRLESDPELASDERGKSRVDEDDGPLSQTEPTLQHRWAGRNSVVGAAGRCAGSGRGNSRNHDDKNAKKKLLRKAYFDYDEAWRTASSHKAKRHEERTLKRMPYGACVSVVRRSCG